MSDRWELYRSHKLSVKRNFDLEKFNKLSHEYALVSEQLDRLEDELQVRLSRQHIQWVSNLWASRVSTFFQKKAHKLDTY